ncbi:glycyl-radical enzyme activating protein [Synergistes jonesii]|uniref:glycyl-radical enzyme activating protein n=1 Tax=Synergistes jonesii TaxID=2754 RepID=UPI00242A473E|nr:glycyl-radical enzyme activating protein [Synergistes jonesii]
MESPRKTSGTVLRFERSSIYDGDGLRTVLFLKGCPLRCLWCSTPESQKFEPERGMTHEKCTLCGRCVKACPNGALSIEGGRIKTDQEKCAGRFECLRACPNGAITQYGVKMTAAEAVREIAKDELFFFHSGGGLTVSGGEPLGQPEFLKEVLVGCRERGIECAIESSFCAPWEKIEPILPYISLLHTDIKQIDPEKHKKLTGVDNAQILDNIKRADQSPYKFGIVIRTPLIPGINDEDEDLIKLAEYVSGLQKLRFMEFLAYHRLGTETYKRLEREYELDEIQPPEARFMREKALLFKKAAGMTVKINGVPVE